MKLKYSSVALCLWAGIAAHGQMIPAGALMQGQCANKETYKLQAYRLNDGEREFTGYLYEGPLGKGAIFSTVSPDEAATYVCKESAKGRWVPDDGDDQ
jgi:hypothetical protein